MQQKYVVRLMNQERDELRIVVKKLKGTGQKVHVDAVGSLSLRALQTQARDRLCAG
jgi:hypothetical protein